MRRRTLLAAASAIAARDALALPPATLRFPRDHGSHPGLRTEWWYVTGFAGANGREFGFQVTFFRSRVDATQALRSRFAAKQLVFAHAAVTDLRAGRLVHDQRIAREGFGIASAEEGDARMRLRDWQLRRDERGTYEAVIPASGFRLDLRCAPTQPLLLQGVGGLSRKGPDEKQASYYYSEPQLAATGRLRVGGESFEVAGKAWLDHEWSEELLHPEAVGWDWIGMNLEDGGAITAFQLRRNDGSALWTGGSVRGREGGARIASPGEVAFTSGRRWTSALSGATYPVEWTVRTTAGVHTVRALLDNQELDSRASTGAIYWEGLSELLDGAGRRVGRGYLEMTGYGGRLRL